MKDGEVIATSTNKSKLKLAARTKESIKLERRSTSIIAVKTPPGLQCNTEYILDISDSLPEGVIPLEVIHKFNKTP